MTNLLHPLFVDFDLFCQVNLDLYCSMHRNQRQKKRNAEFKNKYHEKAKAKGRDKEKRPLDDSEKARKDAGPSKTRSDAQTAQVLESSSGLESSDTKVSEKVYSRRQVVSNWDRYTEDDGSSATVQDDVLFLEKRLLQLLNLPSAATGAAPHELLSAPPASTVPLDGHLANESQNSFSLELDCHALVESLADMPLHVKLDLDPNLMDTALTDNNDDTHNTGNTSEGTGKLEEDKHDSAASELHAKLANTTKSSRCMVTEVLIKKDQQFDFTQPAPWPCAPVRTTASIHCESTSVVSRESSSSMEEGISASGSQDAELDAELDLLIARGSTTNPLRETQPHAQDTSAVCPSSGGGDALYGPSSSTVCPETVPKHEALRTGTSNRANVPVSQTDELDDMLDELLDS